MWMTLAHEAVRTGLSPHGLTKYKVAESYVSARLEEAGHRGVLNLLAACAPVNIENDAQMLLLGSEAQMSAPQVREVLGSLVKTGIVQAGGRIRRIVPDPIVDHLLRSQLIGKDETITGRHSELLAKCGPVLLNNVVRNIARVEAREGRGFFSDLFQEIRKEAPSMTNAIRSVALDLIEQVAWSDPGGSLEIVLAFLNTRRELDQVSIDFYGLGEHLHPFEHKLVATRIPKVLRPALYHSAHASAALEVLEELALQEVPGNQMGQGAKEVFTSASGFHLGLPIGLSETLLAAIELRVESLIDQRPADLLQRLQFLIGGIQAFLSVRLETSRYRKGTLQWSIRTLSIVDGVRVLRSRALALLDRLSHHEDVLIRALVSLAVVNACSSLVEAGSGHADEGSGLSAEQFLVDSLALAIARREEAFVVLRPLADSAYWVLDYDKRSSRIAWAKELDSVLSEKPLFTIKASLFGEFHRRKRRSFGNTRTDARLLSGIPEEVFIDTLVDWSDDAGGTSGRLVRILETYGLLHPKKAQRIVEREIKRGIRPKTTFYVGALFGAVRARSGPGILKFAAGFGAWQLARIYADFFWWASGIVPNSVDDQMFLTQALERAAPDEIDTLLKAISVVTDDAGRFLEKEYMNMLQAPGAFEHRSALIDGLHSFLESRRENEAINLSPLLLKVAGQKELFDSRNRNEYQMQQLLIRAAQKDPGLLPEFLSIRLDALLLENNYRQLWPHNAHYFARSANVSNDTRRLALKVVISKAIENQGDVFISFLSDMVWDISGYNLSLLAGVILETLGAKPDKESLYSGIAFLRELGFNEPILLVYEDLLDKANLLPLQERRDIQNDALSNLYGYSWMTVGDEIPQTLLGRRDMIRKRLEDPAAKRHKAFYERLNLQNEATIESTIRDNAERDISLQ